MVGIISLINSLVTSLLRSPNINSNISLSDSYPRALNTIKRGTLSFKPGNLTCNSSVLLLILISVVLGYLNLPCGTDFIFTV